MFPDPQSMGFLPLLSFNRTIAQSGSGGGMPHTPRFYRQFPACTPVDLSRALWWHHDHLIPRA